MVYNSQKGRGFNDIFGTLTSTFKPIAEGAANVGANLATGLVSDLLSGKTPKPSIKERGNQAKGMVAQRALQSLQGGRGDADVGIFHPVVWVGAIKQQNVNEVVQKVNLRRNVVNKREDVFFLPPFIIPPGIILVTI